MERPAIHGERGAFCARRQRAGVLKAECAYGRTAMPFLTLFTPLTFIAMSSAVLRSAAFFAKPDNITVPFNVSTLIDEASTAALST